MKTLKQLIKQNWAKIDSNNQHEFLNETVEAVREWLTQKLKNPYEQHEACEQETYRELLEELK